MPRKRREIVSVTLSPYIIKWLTREAKRLKMSRSALVEGIVSIQAIAKDGIAP